MMPPRSASLSTAMADPRPSLFNPNRYRLSSQIQVGIGTLLLLLILVGGVAWAALGTARDGFTGYRGLARETNASSQLQLELAQARIQAVYFLWRNDQTSLDRFHKEWSEMQTALEEAETRTMDEARGAVVADIRDKTRIYSTNFDTCAAQVFEAKRLSKEAIPAAAERITGTLNGLVQVAFDTGATEAGMACVEAIQEVAAIVQGLEHAWDDRSAATMDTVRTELGHLAERLTTIGEQLDTAATTTSLETATAAARDLSQDVTTVLHNLAEVDRITREVLYTAGVAIFESADTIKTDVRALQDEMGPRQQRELATAETEVAVLAVVAIALGLLLGVALTRPVKATVRQFKGIAQAAEDLTHRMPEQGNRDMVELARDFNGFVGRVQTMVQGIARRAHELTDQARQLDETATQMGDTCGTARGQSNDARMSSEEVAQGMTESRRLIGELAESVRIGAAAVEEMTASITDVADSANRTLEVSSRAAVMSADSNTQIQKLEDAAREIGQVIATIEEIAEQTNLLALNATIEAARAGDAGRGFAVVAGEVKDLARQTADATHDIRERVENIQGTSRTAAESVRQITEVIDDVNKQSDHIAETVGEQRGATNEISNTLSRTSESADQVVEQVERSSAAGEQIQRVLESLDQTSEDLSQRSASTVDMGHQVVEVANGLESDIGRFKY